MIEVPPDSLFKLRLPGPLRDKLEKEASAHGRTLTGEILSRLESTFDGDHRRLDEIEELVNSTEYGNVELHRMIQEIRFAWRDRYGDYP